MGFLGALSELVRLPRSAESVEPGALGLSEQRLSEPVGHAADSTKPQSLPSRVDSLAELAANSDGPLKDTLRTGKADFYGDRGSASHLIGEFNFGARRMQGIADSYSAVLRGLREYSELDRFSFGRKALIQDIEHEMKSKVLDPLADAGVNMSFTDPRSETAGSHFLRLFAVPLNSHFIDRKSKSTLDLNRVGQLREALVDRPGHLTDDDDEYRVGFNRLWRFSSVPDVVRGRIFEWQRAFPYVGDFVDPKLMSSLERGEERRVPAVLSLRVPYSPKYGSLVFTQVEEVSHLFQRANQSKALSPLGVQLERALADKPEEIKQLNISHPIEYDYIGILRAFGVTVPDYAMVPHARTHLIGYLDSHR